MERLERRDTPSITPFLPPRIVLDAPIDSPSSVEMHDLNGDHLPDLVFATAQGMQWMRQSATGFEPPAQLSDSNWQLIADLNGDGYVDGVGWDFVRSGYVFLNDRNGQFLEHYWTTGAGGTIGSSEPRSLFDIDRDGDLDLAYAARDVTNSFQGVGWRANDGLGSFGPFLPLIPLNDRFRGVRTDAWVADLDRDGDWDAVTMEPHPDRTFDHVVRWYENETDGVVGHDLPLELPIGTDAEVTISDATGDGVPELLVYVEGDSSRATEVLVFERNDTNGQFERWAPFPQPENVTRVHFADFDRDGDLDVARLRGNQLEWIVRQADGTFDDPVQILAAYSSPLDDLAVGDWNQDGAPDLVVVSESYDRVSLWTNQNHASFTEQSLNASSIDGILEIVSADLDGDARQDLILRGTQLWWLRAEEDAGHFEPPQTLWDQPTEVLRVVDLDADGDIDLALSDGQLRVLLNNGQGAMSVQTLDASGRSLAVTDWDEDGDLDLLVAQRSTEFFGEDGPLLGWLENVGRGQFHGFRSLVNISSHPDLIEDNFFQDNGAIITDMQPIRAADGRIRVALQLEQRIFDLFVIVLVGRDDQGNPFVSNSVLRVDQDDTSVIFAVVDADESGTDELFTAIVPDDNDGHTLIDWWEVTPVGAVSRSVDALKASMDIARLQDVDYIASRSAWLSFIFPQVGGEMSRRFTPYTDSWPSLPTPVDVTSDGSLDLVAIHSGRLIWMESATGRDWLADGRIDDRDIDVLSRAIVERSRDSQFDVDSDGQVGPGDLHQFVTRELGLHPGDVNLDGRFDSSDLVAVFQRGKFEMGGPVVWSEGDFDGDGKFSSSDFVTAFRMGYFAGDDDD